MTPKIIYRSVFENEVKVKTLKKKSHLSCLNQHFCRIVFVIINTSTKKRVLLSTK